MRTKALLFGVALTAAGIATSLAQSNVYSLNVVGYVNVPLAGSQFALLANPLDDGTNDLNSLVGSLPAKSSAQLWTGTGFTNSTKSSTVWSPNLTVAPGTGFFVKPFGATPVTNTFVGQVVVGPGGSVTNTLPNTFVLVGSPIPYAGDLNTTNINLLSLPAKSSLQIWTGVGYTNATKSSTVWSPALPLSVAQGFFVKAFSSTSWAQSLPAN